MSNTASVPPPPGITPNFEHPEDGFYTINLVSVILCMGVVTPIVLLRLYTRARIQHSMNVEDWVCLIAWLIYMQFMAANLIMGHFKGGYHQWEVTKLQFRHFMMTEYASAVLYVPMIYSIKIIILLIFTRIFAASRKTIFLTYFIMGVITCFYVPMLFLKIFMCDPISGFWDASLNPKCIDEDKLFLADTLVSVISDLSVSVLPLPAVWALRLPVKTKIKILGLLGAGIMATATTIVRLVLLLQGKAKIDLTYEILRLALLGGAEASIGLICTSLPALHAFVATVKMQRSRPSDASVDAGARKAVNRVADHSIGSSGKAGKKRGIWRKGESILQWTYSTTEDENERGRDVELGLAKSAVSDTSLRSESMIGIKGSSVGVQEVNGKKWMEVRTSQEGAKDQSMPVLPKIKRLSKLSLWQDIQGATEAKTAVDFGVTEIREGEQESEREDESNDWKMAVLENRGDISKPSRTWENR